MFVFPNLQHFSRELYAYNGTLEKADHGLIYLPFDRTGAKYLQDIAEMRSMKKTAFDPDLAYTGYPYYFPVARMLQ